jgi:hypothetical protein
MKIKKISHKLISKANAGRLWLKHYSFEKVRVFAGRRDGEMYEMPFSEDLFLISLHKQSIWLKPEQLFDLKNLLEEMEQGGDSRE